MPLLDYDYDYSAYSRNVPKRSTRDVARNHYQNSRDFDNTYGDLALKPKKKRVFDQDTAVGLMQSPYEKEMHKYDEDYRQIEEKVKRKSFDYESESRIINRRKYDEVEEIELEEVEETEEEIQEKKAIRKAKREKIVGTISNVFLFISIACIALFICYRFSLINEKFNEVEKAKKRLANAQTINEQIQADIDSETDISYIENYAKYQLGMQKPQAVQTVYINIEKQDKIITPVNIDEEYSEKTWLTSIVENLASLFE